ncbi:MAG: ABC transporter [Candidatus Moranbacteria bacterium RIFCSPLOWO2_02_FULL_48_19]|nr:MAG: ABC transporter [Candidatus Moranbacteria bacterium RIFCSPLOWO2_02_FULL_48_19]OGI31428.1 MAG: ABC transporter [Candidatus Moranbacteria bacterium RIFCSPLOWO2_12_FULL_48_12]
MPAALSVKQLKKVYSNGVVALKGIDLVVPEGEFFGLLGPNGAGKTTIIGIIVGLVNKTSGRVEVLGHDLDMDTSQARASVGIVPQEFNFSIFEKVQSIVVDQAGYYGIPRAVALPRAEKYLKQLGLWEKRNSAARMLSGGMKRRLMIARALIHEPKLLILDEPTAGVDIELRREMWVFLKELNTAGRTIILTTHYLEEAEQLCRSVAIIHEGEIIEQGLVKDLLSKMHVETFVFDLEAPLSSEVEKLLTNFGVQKIDSQTIEMSLGKDETLSDAIVALNRLDIRVRSMRNKANRLEELFLHLTKKV